MVSKILIVGPEDQGPTRSPEKAWRVVGWFGLLLVVVGLMETLLVLSDPGVTAGREYQRIAASLGRLPLPSLGMGLWIASALARGHRALLLTTGLAALLLAAVILGVYAYFLSVVPAGLRGLSVVAGAEVKRVLVRATVAGIGSSIAHAASGVLALRHVRRASPG